MSHEGLRQPEPASLNSLSGEDGPTAANTALGLAKPFSLPSANGPGAANTALVSAESVAKALLDLPVTPACLQDLVPLLQSEAPPRGGASPHSFSWSSGAYVQGSLIGLRHHCSSHPLCTKLLCRCVNSILPELEFTSVALFQDIKAPPHVDRNNALGYPNALIACSVFAGVGSGSRASKAVTLVPTVLAS